MTFTFLGEGVSSAADAEEVVQHYRRLLDLIGNVASTPRSR